MKAPEDAIAAGSRTLKVRALPLQPHCFAFGGFEIQMLSTIRALREAGLDVQPLSPWDRDCDFDVLHVWGFDLAHLHSVYWAKRAGKRVVMTALLPYMDMRNRLRYVASWLSGPARMRQRLLAMVDALVVVNDAQAATARKLLGVAPERLIVIPNIVDARYFSPAAGWSDAENEGQYVLCAGNVCARKNQLTLAKAARAAACPLVIIGDVLVGEERYGEELAAFCDREPRIRWLRQMPAASPDLVGAYRGARVFALASLDETQPIALLEAAAARKALVVSNLPFAHQRLYRNAYLVQPRSVQSICSGLRAAMATPERYIPPFEALQDCTTERVAWTYLKVYESLFAAEPRHAG